MFSFWKIISYPVKGERSIGSRTMRIAIVVAYPAGNEGIHCIRAIPTYNGEYLSTCLFQLCLYSKIQLQKRKEYREHTQRACLAF